MKKGLEQFKKNDRIIILVGVSLICALVIPHCVLKVFADTAAVVAPLPVSTPSGIPVVVVTTPVLSGSDFLSQVFAYVKGLGGISFMLKISGLITLIIASMKVSFLNNLIWSKFGNFKAFVAPLLSLIIGVISLGAGGAHITFAAIGAYLFSGGGAVILHEILDTLKAIPGIGPVYVSFINWVSSSLGGNSNSSNPTTSS